MSYQEARIATLFLQSVAFLDRLFEDRNPYTLDWCPRYYLIDLCRRTYSSYKHLAYPYLDAQKDEIVTKRLNRYSFKNIGVNERLFKNVSSSDGLKNFLPNRPFFVWDFEFDYAAKCLLESVKLEKTAREGPK
jgi:hypothetical protein